MSTSILPGERPDRLEEECAVFGVFAPGEDVARMTCFGLQALQHRGQESAGIAVGDGATVMVSKDLGLVTQVFDEASLAALEGFVAVGHARYSTSGGAASWEAAQPHISAIDDVLIALAHNGTLVNTNALRARLVDEGVQFRSGTDSEVAAKAIGRVTQETHHLRNGIRRAMEELSGAYAMVLASPDSLYAFRDPNGIRPLCIGELPDGRGWAVSSETCGLDIVGARYVRDVAPGEIVRFNDDGMHAEQGVAARKSAACIFEYVYFARPDSVIDGQSVYQARRNMGRILAQEAPVEADLVLGVPDSGVPHAIGYATECKTPFARPFIKYTPTWARSFMPSNQEVRNRVAKMKQIHIPELINEKKLLFVDDSIVRGTQLNETVDFLYKCGAEEVHMRSACPPIMFSCKYLSFSSSRSDMELLARRMVDQLEGEEGVQHLDEYADGSTERGKCMLKSICEQMGFDSLGYQSLDGMLEAIGIDPEKVCTYCWTGKE